MKLVSVARAQGIFALPATFFVTVPIFDLVDAFKDKFQFRHVPSGHELLTPPPNQPTNFVWGKTTVNGEPVTIEGMQIETYGTLATTVTVTTRTCTDDCDAILADMREWLRAVLLLEPKSVLPTNYFSQLDITLEKSPEKRLAFLKLSAK
jgi:hypothetical protein